MTTLLQGSKLAETLHWWRTAGRSASWGLRHLSPETIEALPEDPDEIDRRIERFLAASEAAARRKRLGRRLGYSTIAVVLTAALSWTSYILAENAKIRNQYKSIQALLHEVSNAEADVARARAETMVAQGKALTQAVKTKLAAKSALSAVAIVRRTLRLITEDRLLDEPDLHRSAYAALAQANEEVIFLESSGTDPTEPDNTTEESTDGTTLGGLQSAAFSPDGSQIVTASNSGVVRVWNARTGKQIALLSGHKEAVWTGVFSPDGGQILTASSDTTARIWKASDGLEITALNGHESVVYTAAYSPPDGLQIVTASEDSTARVWSVATGKELALLQHESSVWCAAFSPDGTWIVTGSRDGTVRIWNAVNREEVRVLSEHTGGVMSVAFSPDGNLFVTTSDDNTARVWDTVSGEPVHVLSGHIDWVSGAAFSQDGKQLVTASADRTARIWSVETGLQIDTLTGHDNSVWSATFSPDEPRRVLTASVDKTARIWPLSRRHRLAFHPFDPAEWTGNPVVKANSLKRPGHATIWTPVTEADVDPQMWQMVQNLPRSVEVLVAVAEATGKVVATLDKSGAVKIWAADDRAEIAEIDLSFAGRLHFPGLSIEIVGENIRIFADYGEPLAGAADGASGGFLWEVPLSVQGLLSLVDRNLPIGYGDALENHLTSGQQSLFKGILSE